MNYDMDSDGNSYIQLQPWYKKWWIWLFVILICLCGKAYYDINLATIYEAQNKVSTIGTYKFDDQRFSIAEEKTYKTNYAYTSWRGADIKVTKVKIYKMTHPEKYRFEDEEVTKKIRGFATIFMTVKAKKNICVDLDEETAIFSNLDEVPIETYHGFDDDIKAGKVVQGYIKVPIEHLKNVTDITALRLDFGGSSSNESNDSLDKEIKFVVRLRN